MTTYTKEQLGQALQLQNLLIAGGVDGEYAEMRVQKSIGRLDEGAAALAREILETTPEKWKGGESASPGAPSNEKAFYDELRRRIRAELDAKKGPDMRAELDRRIGRDSGGGR